MAGKKKKRDPNKKKKARKKKKGPSGPPNRSSTRAPAEPTPSDTPPSDHEPLSDDAYEAERQRVANEYGTGSGVLTKMRSQVSMGGEVSDGFFRRRRPLWEWALWFAVAYGIYRFVKAFILPVVLPEAPDPS